ncbi:DNA primase family protein [Deinococcus peraridilitoris]|uniref:Phage/plasmid primase, P4 family, C-terminal domain protein n=1 Tax=Deinococcus peraridilitoris (strain DSM 19664 / LMG 22246 / CIP 109416 / KR-200) TaxID=937777 RepID=K9ZYW6_DEIPD|nr:DNA primase family protein [Deinococcus peraridilitoris]AFZ66092.1 phage/plasmid primase, P4 family, C-terminal domain protein [Deinococcus peraridilitoris DSM 19664]
MTFTLWQWANLLYDGMMPKAGFMEFRLLGQRGKIDDRLWMEWPTPEALAPNLPKKWMQGAAYFGIALRTPEGQAANSGTKKDTQPTHLVWSEIDLKGTRYTDGQTDVENMTGDELRQAAREAFDDVQAILEEHNLPARAIVYSGQGLHVYLARRARSTQEDTEAYCRGLCNLLEGDPSASEQARILRVPGTFHRKNPERPLAVEVWHADPAAFVDDGVLESHAVRQQHTRTASDGTFINNGQAIDADLKVIAAQWKDLKNTAHPSGQGRHYLALYTAGWLKQNGYSEGDADAIVRNLAQEAHDEELPDRLRAVRDTYRTETPGKGWTGLTETFGLELQGIILKEGPKPNIRGAGTQIAEKKRTPAAGKLTLVDYAAIFLEYNREHNYEYAYHEHWQKWFEYQHGVYTEVLDTTMRKRLDLVMQERGLCDLKKSDLNEILLKVAHTPGIGKARVDQQPWELNCANGILDLNTLELAEHTPEYFSVVQTGTRWDPEATSAEWAEFLTTAVPNPADRAILQRYCGYALTGDTSAQKALLLIGEGGTGKSTFVRVISAALGGLSPYSLATSSALENIRDGSFIVGTLVGKRLCVISELQRNVDWLPFKRITGEDPISIDVKNKDAFITKLDTKLIILSNVLPFLGEDASNSSLTRRFLPVSFNVRPKNPDPTLEARLSSPENLSGTLTWMVKGLVALRADNMRFPVSSQNSLERQIVEQSNRLITFLEEVCIGDPAVSVANADLWAAYLRWCEDTRHKAVSSTRFGTDLPAALRQLGWEAEQRRSGKMPRTWFGLGLRGGFYRAE